ncbi:DUF3016 domain-containing protein [Paracidovorax citrulli]|uniref:DUF3016 domain-containing protein n=2 Tax=Paracidovorax citrulli TaxID=80869 RepID=A1TJ79_PARC0|nr:DUF3016 domain-containing protein [Paracidovorax citrulli]ABM31017.1 conserved hypothetical protein [Paracidovorax citrulli AAC00-1]ATG95823.1 DUF3016 domain-containing protein [Paracidovorax citrulli]MVT37915.1 DUF3016 domain-containing protein [Paracidovorax citrulli]PVY65197.1 hypothetical protein C8E08_2550 [Paracidovorax citrulli]REG70613.1 hypothetical protein C8E07_3825 [Paracidovorax citrulli]
MTHRLHAPLPDVLRRPAPGRVSAALALAGLMAGCAGAPGTAPAPARDTAAASSRAKGSPPPGIVSVTYADPAGFSDARRGIHDTEQARRAWVDALCLYLSETAAAALPEGQRLEVRITDVQRAGGFEPWRGPQAGQVRIVRDVYPPRIVLEFKRLAADGSVLQSGRRELRDPAFMERAARGGTDPLRYEKGLIDDWVRQEFGAR